MAKAQREKGKRGEREWANELTKQGFPAKRGVQFQGGPDSPDVQCDELSHLHFEVKRVEKLNIHGAFSQAEEDAGPLQHPLVAHRRSNQPWLVTMSSNTFFDLLKGTA